MTANLNLTRGLVFSQKVLLRLTEKGTSREDAYKIVQTSAMDVWADKSKNMKDELLKSELAMKYLKPEELDEIFNYDKMLKNVDFLFARSVELGCKL